MFHPNLVRILTHSNNVKPFSSNKLLSAKNLFSI